MASVRSLGLHEPSAIPFLVAEQLLPPEPSTDDYVWQTIQVEDGLDGPVDEEVVYTKTCVVWSRCGVLKRVFRLDVEKEEIRHVLFTHFPAEKIKSNEQGSQAFTTGPSQSVQTKSSELQSTRRGRPGLEIPGIPPDERGNKRVHDDENPGADFSRALVVVLKSQAHIFFLTGNSHVVPLPFEVETVFPTPRGLLFQRNGPQDGPVPVPAAPPNSFMSVKTTETRLSAHELSRGSARKPARPSQTISTPRASTWKQKPKENTSLPRVFALMDPHAEMGLVVASYSRSVYGSHRASDFHVLDSAEEIIYMSQKDELSHISNAYNFPLILVVTLNSNTGMYTLWTGRYRHEETDRLLRQGKLKSEATGTRSKRRSSHFGMATGTTTPTARPSGVRESFGSINLGRSISGMPNPQSHSAEGRGDGVDDFATQLGQEFGDIAGPSKTSRRVSSMLARADLATNQDRATFSELATGNQAYSNNFSLSRQSLGGFNPRESIDFNPRSSMTHAGDSMHHTGGPLDFRVNKLLQELNNGGSLDGFEDMDLRESTAGLSKELMLSKIESFPGNVSLSFDTTSTASTKPKIFTLGARDGEDTHNKDSASIAVCISDDSSKSLTLVSLKAERVVIPRKGSRSGSTNKPKKGSTIYQSFFAVHVAGITHSSDILGACRLVDGQVSRILTLGMTAGGQNQLILQSPWSVPTEIELPSLSLNPPREMSLSRVSNKVAEPGAAKSLIDITPQFIGLDNPSMKGRVDAVDSRGRRHRLQIRMEPRNALVRKVIAVCKFVLRDLGTAGEGILVGWWQILNWLRSKNHAGYDLEWTAMVVLLFTMAVDFIASSETKAEKTRRRRALPRTSSGSLVDLQEWEAMLDQEAGPSGFAPSWMMNPAWSWVTQTESLNETDESRPRRTAKTEQRSIFDQSGRLSHKKNPYVTQCASLAREFLRNPIGQSASGAAGYLPTASSRNEATRRTALCSILIGLHFLREEQKLFTYESEMSYRKMGMLAPVLAQIGRWLGWGSWTWKQDTYYGSEMASIDCWSFEDSQISKLNVPPEPFPPPSIFASIENVWREQPGSFLTLLEVVSEYGNTQIEGRLWQQAFGLTPRTLALRGYLSEARSSSSTLEKVELLLRWGLTRNVIETFPDGVSAPLFEAITRCQVNPPASWTSALLELIDRDDLYVSTNSTRSVIPVSRPQHVVAHDAVRDFHHIGSSALDIDAINSFEASAEADKSSITRLIFNEDRRFVEAAKLLNQSKAPVAECLPEPEWSDSDLLEAQKELVQLVTLRTLSIPAGRSMFMFSSRSPLLTEKLPIPSFSLQCVMKPSNVTISADRASFSEEKVCWAFFHNGVSTGLAISKSSKGIDTSWILFNKPQELTNRHAGFLFALGLNGHLKTLAKWVAFKYLTPKHTMTSIGLLLGLSASYLGTMDTLITRLLSVHVTRMLPPGAAELNLSHLTQTAGIMGIGLLYCNSQHRRMSEVMLSELENVSREESTISQEDLRDEGYRLAAGFALGFINLGKGKDLRGLRDMNVVERLLAIAVGTKNVDLVHILDRATAGATIALMIIFMKTNDEALARKIDIPDTIAQFDYVRPDIFLLRTVARHLIMWDNIRASHEWLLGSLPQIYRRRNRLASIHRLNSDDMPFFNIIAGLCFTIGLRYAGSALPQARDLLVSYLDQFMRICRLPAVNYDGKLARNSVRNCQDIVALSAAAVMAGTGDLIVFRRLRSLHGRVDPDTPYGSHMAAHMAIGLLFLAGGTYTLGTSDLAIASLLCALYPIFPTTVLDNKCHLQAFRHMWVLATESRCLVPRDLDMGRPVSTPISLTMKSGLTRTVTAPCLLPDLKEITIIKLQSPNHWPIVLDLERNNSLREKFYQGDQSVYLRRRTSFNPSGSSVFASTLQGLSEMQDILPSIAATGGVRGATAQGTTASPSTSVVRASSRDLWEWIFSLPSLRELGFDERAMIIHPISFQSRPLYTRDGRTVTSPPWLRPSAVDTKLTLQDTVKSIIQTASGTSWSPDEVKDRLWQLRLLFAWADHNERQGGDNDDEDPACRNGLWLRKDVIEDARWKIWGVQFSEGASKAESR
ncbi:20S cyclosome subunit (APC1/BimE), putative [Paecilomyces variotii No. 5]|uniref:20S cyclosome subunit (APC1/BimE), putative n=1 Tax=Byssochlamys spectabilis (strain No. 5 / NBRC 109023) TaxID=1356009 RepID=V5F8J0_BYSSN|nr:20S cyclosome subunit (APC1/BimE), putative [Paecilomyces variotii No. 5]